MKKEERLANKKRKTAALVNIIEINEDDRKPGRKRKPQEAGESQNSSESEEKVVTSSDTVS